MQSYKREQILRWLQRASESPNGLSLRTLNSETRVVLLNAIKTIRDAMPEYRGSITLVNATDNELWIIPKDKVLSNGGSERETDEAHPEPE
jgi:hypothetical protein